MCVYVELHTSLRGRCVYVESHTSLRGRCVYVESHTSLRGRCMCSHTWGGVCVCGVTHFFKEVCVYV